MHCLYELKIELTPDHSFESRELGVLNWMRKMKPSPPQKKKIQYIVPTFDELVGLFVGLGIFKEGEAVVPASTYGGISKCHSRQTFFWKRNKSQKRYARDWHHWKYSKLKKPYQSGAISDKDGDSFILLGKGKVKDISRGYSKRKLKCYIFFKDEVPVLMRGAWHITKLVAGSSDPSARHVYHHTNDEVRNRFFEFYKVTALYKKQAEFWADKIQTLMLRSDKKKRRVYHRTSLKYTDYLTVLNELNARNQRFYVFGEQYCGIEPDQFAVIKAIYRHIKKLTELTNSNEEKQKWQQLIQQAI